MKHSWMSFARTRHATHKFLATLLLTFSATSAHAWYQFGYQGQNGFSGQNGQDGTGGRTASIHADGSYQFYDLRGGDGGNGASGSDGQSAYSCFQPYNTPYDLQGAQAGSGGDAGRGGNAGNGGDATVFFQDQSQLKNITINNLGGRAGLAGRAGMGGYGCRCQMYNWTNVVCWNHCDTNGYCHRVCENRFFSCYDGRDGQSGLRSQDGFMGKVGSLKLVKGLTSLPVSNDRLQAQLQTVLMKSVELSKPVWSVRSGAEAFFSSSSQLDTVYQNFDGLQKAVIKVDWKAMASLKSYENEIVSLTLLDEPAFQFVNQSIWDVTEKFYDGAAGVWNLTVKQALTETEVLAISPEAVTGTMKNTALILRDPKFLSVNVGNALELVVKGRGFFGATTIFKGKVDPRLIEAKADEVKIYLGLLDLNPNKLKVGEKIALEIKLTRSLGSKSATKTMNFSTVLQ